MYFHQPSNKICMNNIHSASHQKGISAEERERKGCLEKKKKANFQTCHSHSGINSSVIKQIQQKIFTSLNCRKLPEKKISMSLDDIKNIKK